MARSTAVQKTHLWHMNDRRCWYCGHQVPEAKWTIDHVIPLSAGGPRRDPANVVPCCTTCNKLKNNADLETFRKHPRLRARRRMLRKAHPNRTGTVWRFAFELGEPT